MLNTASENRVKTVTGNAEEGFDATLVVGGEERQVSGEFAETDEFPVHVVEGWFGAAKEDPPE